MQSKSKNKKKRTFMQIFKELVFSLKETFYKRSLRYENISVTFCVKNVFFAKKNGIKKKRERKSSFQRS